MNKVLLGILAVSSVLIGSDADLSAGHRRKRRCRTYCIPCAPVSSCTPCCTSCPPVTKSYLPCTCALSKLFQQNGVWINYAQYYYDDAMGRNCWNALILPASLPGDFDDLPHYCGHPKCENASLERNKGYDGTKVVNYKEYMPAHDIEQGAGEVTNSTKSLREFTDEAGHKHMIGLYEVTVRMSRGVKSFCYGLEATNTDNEESEEFQNAENIGDYLYLCTIGDGRKALVFVKKPNS